LWLGFKPKEVRDAQVLVNDDEGHSKGQDFLTLKPTLATRPSNLSATAAEAPGSCASLSSYRPFCLLLAANILLRGYCATDRYAARARLFRSAVFDHKCCMMGIGALTGLCQWRALPPRTSYIVPQLIWGSENWFEA